MLDIIETIQQLTNIPSPTGYTAEIIGFLDENLKKKGYQPERNQTGWSLKNRADRRVHLPFN